MSVLMPGGGRARAARRGPGPAGRRGRRAGRRRRARRSDGLEQHGHADDRVAQQQPGQREDRGGRRTSRRPRWPAAPQRRGWCPAGGQPPGDVADDQQRERPAAGDVVGGRHAGRAAGRRRSRGPSPTPSRSRSPTATTTSRTTSGHHAVEGEVREHRDLEDERGQQRPAAPRRRVAWRSSQAPVGLDDGAVAVGPGRARRRRPGRARRSRRTARSPRAGWCRGRWSRPSGPCRPARRRRTARRPGCPTSPRVSPCAGHRGLVDELQVEPRGAAEVAEVAAAVQEADLHAAADPAARRWSRRRRPAARSRSCW